MDAAVVADPDTALWEKGLAGISLGINWLTGGIAPNFGAIVRLRHFTNSKGLKGIQQNGVIKASDQNKVFAVRAKGKAPAPRDIVSV